jgi:hypothetical protein
MAVTSLELKGDCSPRSELGHGKETVEQVPFALPFPGCHEVCLLFAGLSGNF